MKIKFKTFYPETEYCSCTGTYTIVAANVLNRWLAENPNVEIISWQATPVGTTNEIDITIQYRELEED